jgi:hypothetical protein
MANIVPTILQTWHQGNIASVAASAINTFEIRTGNNVHGFNLCFKAAGGITPLTRAQLITDVASVRCWLNGEPIYDRTTTQILDAYKRDMDKYGALAAPLGVIPIRFTNRRCLAFDQWRGFAVGMLKKGGVPGQGPYNVLTVEVAIAAGVATAAVGEIHVISDMYAQEETGLHIRSMRTTRDLLVAGVNIINDMPRAPYAYLNIDIATAQVMTRLTVLYDQSYLHRDIDADGLAILMDEGGMTPQANYAHIPFNVTADLNANFPLSGLSSFELQPSFPGGAPGAGAVILTDEIWNTVRE